MKKLALLIWFLAASVALAHPMGNFSINHYSAISISQKEVDIHYIIDLAEIPTFQEMPNLDRDGNQDISDKEGKDFSRQKAIEFVKLLSLDQNGQELELRLKDSALTVLRGAGGLPTLLVKVDYYALLNAPADGAPVVSYRDNNFAERIGWKEIVLHKISDVRVLQSSVTTKDRSKQLTEYPQDPTISPPQELTARIRFAFPVQAQQPEPKPVAPSVQALNIVRTPPIVSVPKKPAMPNKREDGFTRLIGTHELNLQIILFSLVIAFGLGAMHALSPGHGKTIVAGYLIGARGTGKHAVFLGATVTLTHTIGVFALGLITLYFSKYILPERLYPWVGVFSGVSIVLIGAALFRKRLALLKPKHHHQHHEHEHEHEHHHHSVYDHDHDHGTHGHSHLPVDAQTGSITWKSLLTVGISGGALPCPSALVVLLSAISLHRIGFGLLLIVAFSLGLALVLTSIGLLLVYAANLTRKVDFSGAFLRRMPLVSSLIIAILGFAIAIQSLMQI